MAKNISKQDLLDYRDELGREQQGLVVKKDDARSALEDELARQRVEALRAFESEFQAKQAEVQGKLNAVDRLLDRIKDDGESEDL